MRIVSLVLFLFLLTACGKSAGQSLTVLSAPSGIKPEAAAQVDRGNSLYASRDWTGAEEAFRQAIAADPGVAEAHYNLALALDRQGKQAEAKKHYVEAANLAPGNKVIWDSPPLRPKRDSFGYDVEKKSYQDPTYKGF
ncbi:MAG TPA: tetratricopeptide repeat protein [Nitrospira sp.]|nr:tetratricopeptide repeat protein [Nitrospira sp.]